MLGHYLNQIWPIINCIIEFIYHNCRSRTLVLKCRLRNGSHCVSAWLGSVHWILTASDLNFYMGLIYFVTSCIREKYSKKCALLVFIVPHIIASPLYILVECYAYTFLCNRFTACCFILSTLADWRIDASVKYTINGSDNDCRQFGDNPLSEPMIVYCQWDPNEHFSTKFDLKFGFK